MEIHSCKWTAIATFHATPLPDQLPTGPSYTTVNNIYPCSSSNDKNAPHRKKKTWLINCRDGNGQPFTKTLFMKWDLGLYFGLDSWVWIKFVELNVKTLGD